MGAYVGRTIVKKMIAAGKYIRDTNVLIMGITFKENVRDIRNSKVVDVVNELRSYMVHVDITDPLATPDEVAHEYGLSLTTNLRKDYDAIIVAVAHKSYLNLNEEYFISMMSPDALLVDIKGIYRNKIKKIPYWSL